MGLGVSSGKPMAAQTSRAVPAEDWCATMGCMVSFRFSTNIFQLQSCM